MNKLNKVLQAILIVLPILLLYRLFGNEEFTRMDYILIIIISVVGIILIVKGKYGTKGDQISFK